MKKSTFYLAISITAGLFLSQSTVFAASTYYGAWLPYWTQGSVVQTLTQNITKFKEISPFAYEVNSDGSLKDDSNILQGSWLNWVTAVSELNVKIIPTINWENGTQIYNLLSNPTSTAAHISTLVSIANDAPFSGINIDYEDKTASTAPYFSTFIESLSKALHADKKTLACSVESRTPVADRYEGTPPADATEYANNYTVIGKYCDEVDVLAYDQNNIDVKLDDSKGSNGQLYMPIADPAWVTGVIQQTTASISPSKILLGIPTYGYEYQVTQSGGQTTYNRITSVSYVGAMALAKSVNATPTRNSAGELSFVYDVATTSSSTSEKYVDFKDSVSINQEIQLAKKYKLKGVILFSINPGNDPADWTVLK